MRRSPLTLFVALLVVSPLCLFVSGARAEQAQIAIFNDESRSSCSLSAAGSGMVRAYVFVAAQNGFTGVRFAAPKPDCFSAIWLSDQTDYVSIGDSQTDISISTGVCSTPRLVLTILFQSTSTTAPCCPFNIEPAIGQSEIQYADCAFVERPLTPAIAYINGNETCACASGLDLPPSTPRNESPISGTTNVAVTGSLGWESHDPEGGALKFDLYLGTETDPPLFRSNLTQSNATVGPLASETVYRWKVVAMDGGGNTTAGPVWTFTTSPPTPPPAPYNPSPIDGASDQNRALTLAWTTGTGQVVSYEVHFGTTPTPPVVATVPAHDRTSFPVDSLALDATYYWNVVAIGAGGERTNGPVWSFHTWKTNPPPSAPGTPAPANLSSHVPTALTLSWSASDPESQPLEFDLYFGPGANPPFLAHTLTSHFDVTNLDVFKDYSWRVVVFDSEGASTSGPTWVFRTRGDQPPTVPVLVAPALESVVSPFEGYLEWSAQDPEGDVLAYDVYLGTTTDPPGLVMSIETNHIDFSSFDLAENTTYYWRVTARDLDGLTSTGALWTFKTKDLIPPDAPSNPSPVDAATGVNRVPQLAWQSSDPEGQALHYLVFLGTSPTIGQSYESATNSLQVESPLAGGIQYYWRVTAIDTDHASTVGPWWTFTTLSSNQPPTEPSNPDPADHATGQGATVMLQWSSSDPEGLPLTYTVCFGTTPNPPQIVSHWPQNSFTLYNLAEKDYYWIIIAHDADGNTTYSPRWTFHVGGAPARPSIGMYSDESGTSCVLADNASGLKNIYVVLNGPSSYTGVRFAAPKPSCFNATWMFDSSPYVTIGDSPRDISIGFGSCLAAPVHVMTIAYLSTGNTTGCCSFEAQAPALVGNMVVSDCAFEELVAVSTPLGISSDNACPSCASEGSLYFAETEDSCASGAPRRITVDLEISTAIATDNGTIDVVLSPSLQFVDCERGDLTRDWTTFEHELNGNVLTLTASGGLIPQGVSGAFARITFESNCCEWTTPAELGLTRPLGDLKLNRIANKYLECRYPPNGDVNNDGNLTLADAQCALESYLYAPFPPPGGCGGLGASSRADVNCTTIPTPGDACCIYRQWKDQSCTFCSGTAHPSPPAAPQLAMRSLVEDRELVMVLSASGAGPIGALGFDLTYPKQLEFLRVETARKDVLAALQTRVIEPGHVRVGGYANAGVALAGDGDLVAIRFRARAGKLHGGVAALQFVDDLAGASDVVVSLENTIVTAIPSQIALHQNSPNPFNPQTTIRFELPSAMRARLSIFDVRGRLVRQLLDAQRPAGVSMVEWNGTDDRGAAVATGVYFYVLEAGGTRSQRKMVLLK